MEPTKGGSTRIISRKYLMASTDQFHGGPYKTNYLPGQGGGKKPTQNPERFPQLQIPQSEGKADGFSAELNLKWVTNAECTFRPFRAVCSTRLGPAAKDKRTSAGFW